MRPSPFERDEIEHHHGVFLLLSGLLIVGIGVRQLIAPLGAAGKAREIMILPKEEE